MLNGGIMKVLVVDDDPVALKVLETIVRSMEHEPIAYSDSTDACKHMNEDFDIAILDWMMPEITGLQLVKAIRTKQSSDGTYRYIMIVTALEEEEYINAAFDAGVDDILSKPVDPNELRMRIRVGQRVLDNYRKLTKVPHIKR